jgi:hypothetical protein
MGLVYAIAVQKNVLLGVQDLSWACQTKVWTPGKIYDLVCDKRLLN